MYKSNTQSGNVLFLILIAVALFAALSYAVTQSTRGGGNADSEALGIELAGLTQYGDSISTAILRSKIINQLEDWEICFHSANWGNNEYLATAPVNVCGNDATNVFSPDGMGVSWQEPNEKILDTSRIGDPRYGEYFFTSRRIQSIGNEAKDDIIMVVFYLTRAACIKINDELGINNPGGEPPSDNVQISGTNTPPHNCKFGKNGSFCAGSGSTNIDGDNDELDGQHSGCFYSTRLFSVPDGYVYYKVLTAR